MVLGSVISGVVKQLLILNGSHLRYRVNLLGWRVLVHVNNRRSSTLFLFSLFRSLFRHNYNINIIDGCVEDVNSHIIDTIYIGRFLLTINGV